MNILSLPSGSSVARFGLPFVICVFYLTASLGFQFTADSAFMMAMTIGTGDAAGSSPLWQFLLVVGKWFHLDALVVGKVLSLLLTSSTILLVFLVANEILRDRILSLLVSLVFAMQGWLLQIAPSGSALSLAIVLCLGGIFFALRNEYVVAPFVLGAAALVSWHVVLLMVPLSIDIWMNSVSKRHAWHVILMSWIVFLCAVLPWVVFGASKTMSGIPILLEFTGLHSASWFSMVMLGVLLLASAAGLVLSFSARREHFRTLASVALFTAVLAIIGIAFQVQVWLAAVPLIFILSFIGIAETLRFVGRERLIYSATLVLTGLMLVISQIDYQTVTRPLMVSAIAYTAEFRIAGEWIKSEIPKQLAVESEYPGVVAFYSSRPVSRLNSGEASADILVTTSGAPSGYDSVFRPPHPFDAGEPDAYVTVWRRR